MNESAFPLNRPEGTEYGMTLRDYFAAKAVPAILRSYCTELPTDCDMAANYAYMMADAMLEARDRK